MRTLAALMVLLVGCLTTANADFLNPGFEDGTLNGWNAAGYARVLTSDAQSGMQPVLPKSGRYMARLGPVESDAGNNWADNHLSQGGFAPGETVSFDWNFMGQDYASYDRFLVQATVVNPPAMNNASDVANSTPLYATSTPYTILDLSASSVDYKGGWRHTQAVLPDAGSGWLGPVTITFYAGNTLDTAYPSWVYLDTPAETPELGPLVLMALGLAPIATSRLRRRKRA